MLGEDGVDKRWRVGLGDWQTQSSNFSCTLGKHRTLCAQYYRIIEKTICRYIFYMAPRKNNKGKKKALTVEETADIGEDAASNEQKGGMPVRNRYVD